MATMHSQNLTQLLKRFFFILLAITLTLHALLCCSPTVLFHKELPLVLLSHHKLIVFSVLWSTLVALLGYVSTRPLPIFLLGYTCFKPDHDRRCSLELCEFFGQRSGRFSETSADFMRLIYSKSGLGDETYGPPFIFHGNFDSKLPCAFEEAEEGLLSAASSVLSKHDIRASSISIVIVACSMFSPSPSLSSIIVKGLKLSPSVRTFNLSGMGCSTGTMAIDLAAQMLRYKVGYALILVTENTSLNWYFGDNRHMLVTNCIFRLGTAAALVTSDPAAREAAKMELVGSLRTHHGAEDTAYGCAIQCEDDDGNVGVALTKDLIRVAGSGLKSHITKLAPQVLPVSELLRYVLLVAGSKIAGDEKAAHVPNFMTAFEHMCIHAGGKAVIDRVGWIMRLGDEVVEPARMCLHRFGNTSSSLVFYELAYFEAKGRIKAGDRIWTLAFGTGFKVCSLVWKALRDSSMDPDNPWKDCIHRYPCKIVT